MTGDYGGSRRRRRKIGWPALVIGALVLVAAIFAVDWFWRRPADVRTAQQWAITGPPCPQVTAQAFQAQPVRIHQRFENNGIGFGRGYGHVSCDDIVNDGGRGVGTFTECQFSSPGAIEVTTTAGVTYFLTQAHRATVSVKKDGVSCVLAGNFRGER